MLNKRLFYANSLRILVINIKAGGVVYIDLLIISLTYKLSFVNSLDSEFSSFIKLNQFIEQRIIIGLR